jgi:peptidylamidoglycolate lyase
MLGHVSGIAVDSHNHVFVFHRGKHSVLNTNFTAAADEPLVLCFDGQTGQQISAWGANVFFSPHGLRIDQQDNVWVTDVGRHQIMKFTHDGKLLLELGEKGASGWDARHFNKPTDIALAPDGSFYVSDGYGNSRVAKFSASGQFEFEWGKKGSGPGEFNLPHGITLDRDERVYVADRSNSRVQVFDKNGKFIAAWKSAALGRPWAITFAPNGHLYVVDGGDLAVWPPDRAQLLQLDREGNILAKWSRYGNYDGQLYWPHDIAVGKDGAVYTGEILGRRAQKFMPQSNR